MSQYSFDDVLKMMKDYQASDLILKPFMPPIFRINKSIVKAEMEELSEETMLEYVRVVLNEEKEKKYREDLEFDGSYALSGIGRFRVNMFFQRGQMGMVIRLISMDIPNIQDLLLPQAFYEIANQHEGLVLVTGTTGSGKSTSLAAVINYINETAAKHIVTIEDPIEYLHHDKQSTITQREVGTDTKDFHMAIRAAMRQNPDIILIGEMRDSATVLTAIEAGETGHLVFSTLHTADTAQSIDRIMEFFPKEKQDIVRAQISELIYAVISQKLVPRKDGNGMVPAVEILLTTSTVKKVIRDNELFKLRYFIHNGRPQGMQTFDQSLVDLYQADLISFEDGASRCSSPVHFERYVEGFYHNVDAHF